MSVHESFDTISQLPAGWSYNNYGVTQSQISFKKEANGNGYLEFVSGRGGNCWGSEQDCPKIFVPMPQGISRDNQDDHRGNSWTATLRVKVEDIPYGNAGVGLGIQEEASGEIDSGRVRIYMLLRRQRANNWGMQVNVEENGRGRANRGLTQDANSRDVLLRITYNHVDRRLFFFHRSNNDDSWRELLNGGTLTRQFHRGGVIKQGRIVIMGKNWSDRDQTYRIDDFSLTVDDCPSSGGTRHIAATDARDTQAGADMYRAVVGSLTPGVNYKFQVAAATEAGLGTWSDYTSEIMPAISNAEPAGLVDLARGKPTWSTSVLRHPFWSNRGNDGN